MAKKRKSRRFVCDKTGQDLSCEDNCQVCRYIAFREWARAVAPAESTIERDDKIDAWLKEKAPHLL